MRGMGRGFRRGAVFWIAYWHRCREYRESAKSAREADAKRLLKKRLEEIHGRRFVGPHEERVTFEDLVTGYQDDCKLQGYRSLDSAAKPRTAQLRRFFQFDRALDITKARVRAYQVHRLGPRGRRPPRSTAKRPPWRACFGSPSKVSSSAPCLPFRRRSGKTHHGRASLSARSIWPCVNTSPRRIRTCWTSRFTRDGDHGKLRG